MMQHELLTRSLPRIAAPGMVPRNRFAGPQFSPIKNYFRHAHMSCNLSAYFSELIIRAHAVQPEPTASRGSAGPVFDVGSKPRPAWSEPAKEKCE